MSIKQLHHDLDPLLTAKDIKAALKVSLATVYNMSERKQLPEITWDSPISPSKRANKVSRFKLQDILDFIQSSYNQEHRT